MKNDNLVHFCWLDALRFTAAFMVLFGHSRNDFFLMWNNLPFEQQTLLASLFYLLGRLAHEAVIIFFVLSGFLVGGRCIDRLIHGSFDVKDYLIARFSRIYPPLVMAVIFYYITCFFVPTQKWDWSVALGNVINLQGVLCENLVSPFWSLAYEWWFYMVMAFLGVSASNTKNSIKIMGFVGFCLTVGVFTLGNMRIHYLVIWLIGAFAYIVRPRKPNKIVLLLSVLGTISGVALLQISSGSNSVHLPLQISNRPYLEIYLSLMICLFIQQIILNEPRSIISKSVDKCLGEMSKFSYTLYLSHRIVLMWIFYFICDKSVGQMTVASFALYLCVLIICLFVCWCLYLISEKHTQAIRNKVKTLIG